MYCVYILKSLRKNRYYVGCTKNPEERLERHNNGETKGNKYFRPFEVVYKEDFESLTLARKRESYIKAQKSRKFIEKLINPI